jgi:tetratricopeptide (TPR) repeat protein
MQYRKFALPVLASCLALATAQFAAGAEDKGAPLAAPLPRSVTPLLPAPLPPRELDPSWAAFRRGVTLFEGKRLGESLSSFKKAIDARAELFGRASIDIELALASKEANKAGDSLIALARQLALRDLIPQELEALRAKAGGSIDLELRLMREGSPSSPLFGFIDAALLVVEERGLSRIGDSLKALKLAAAELASYPEAEYWIGKVYLAEGETRLAELQIKRACDLGSSLELPGARFEMLETLAGVYSAQGKAREYEMALREIGDAADPFAGRDEHYRGAMERTLAGPGFDKFMEMYRIDGSLAARAWSALGELYQGDGRPLAVIYLAAAVNAKLTRLIGDIRVDEPSYEYGGLRDLVGRILAKDDRARYAGDSGLWKDLVLLGRSLASEGARDSAKEIWAAATRAPGPWGTKAAEELARPAIGPRRR